jgi:hypothetical protein
MILVTGGAGFIGANFVLDWLAQSDEGLINLDKLTYAGNRENLAALAGDPRHIFVHGDIGDSDLTSRLLSQHQPRAIINFAAESHVDRSIHGPEDFIQTNIVGTFHLLEACAATGAVCLTTADRLSLSACLDRRSLWLAGQGGGGLQRNAPLRTEQPLLGEQGGERPSGARLPPHLWSAGADHQLLEQLWSLPLSREADSVDDRQCPGRQALAGLW